VAEAAVVVAVGGDGVAHGSGGAVVEQAVEAAAVDDTGVGGDELRCGVEIRSGHAAHSIAPDAIAS
jgi:hypothetical protein